MDSTGIEAAKLLQAFNQCYQIGQFLKALVTSFRTKLVNANFWTKLGEYLATFSYIIWSQCTLTNMHCGKFELIQRTTKGSCGLVLLRVIHDEEIMHIQILAHKAKNEKDARDWTFLNRKQNCQLGKWLLLSWQSGRFRRSNPVFGNIRCHLYRKKRK